MTRQVILAGILACGVLTGACAEVSRGLSVKDGRLIKDGRTYRGVGANYFELFRRVMHEPTNTTSLTGLERLAEAGIPFARFGGPYSSKEWEFYLTDKAEYFRRFDLVVRKAEKMGVGLIPSLFWTLSLCETVGEPRDQWGNPQSRTMALMRQYVAEVVCRYNDSPAIWGWEVGNEKNLCADLPNAAEFRPKNGTVRDDITAEHLVVMMSEFAKEVRLHDATRPIFSGNSHSRASSWNNTASKSWKPDTQAQAREIILRDNPAPLDTIGIHFYGDNPVDKELGVWVTNRLHYLEWLRGVADEVKRPIFIGEFGLGERSDNAQVRVLFEALLVEMEQAGIDLAAFWVYDLPSQDKTWNVTFDNNRAYMIGLTAEANRRWNQASQVR